MATDSSSLIALWRSSAVDRERLSWNAHKEALRGSALPPPRLAPQATFLHGFLLPFSLIATTLRHRSLGLAYLRVTVVRALVVGVVAVIAFGSSTLIRHKPLGPWDASSYEPGIVLSETDDADGASHTKRKRVKGVGIDNSGVKLATEAIEEPEAPGTPEAVAQAAVEAKKPWAVRVVLGSWKWIVWFVGFLSAIEGVIVFVSRRWDDWLGHYASSLARVRPEDRFAPVPKLALFDLRWLGRKLKRRVRGYIFVASGIPLLALFQLMPTIGDALFAVGLTLWGWYWLAVFTTAKTAHAWADDGVAPPPMLIRDLRDRSAGKRWLKPVHVYSRIWERVTRGIHAPAAAFERNPRPFLGLALARVVLSLPGLYLLARPIIPIAAGRLCAESDPTDRFSA